MREAGPGASVCAALAPSGKLLKIWGSLCTPLMECCSLLDRLLLPSRGGMAPHLGARLVPNAGMCTTSGQKILRSIEGEDALQGRRRKVARAWRTLEAPPGARGTSGCEGSSKHPESPLFPEGPEGAEVPSGAKNHLGPEGPPGPRVVFAPA